MRKILSLFIVIVTIACSNEEPVVNSIADSPVQTNNSYIRSFSEAMEIADSAINILESTATRSMASRRTINQTATKVFVNKTRTRGSQSNTNDTLLYVFNFDNNEGFAVVSASRNTEALIAVTEAGNYDPDIASGIPAFDNYMSSAKNYISESLTRDPVIPPFIQRKVTHSYSYVNVGPYVTIKWGQNCAEGEYCPNGTTGCGPIAMAQAMSYYEYPTSISLTYPGADVSSQLLSWTDMKSHITSHYLTSCSPNEITVHQATGRFCRQLGELTQSTYNYNPNSTSTYSINLKTAMQSLGYQTEGWSGYNGANLRNSLNSGRIAIMIGQDATIGSGHFWVLDGYKTTIDQVTEWLLYPGQVEWVVDRITTNYYHYNHFNWGWYGQNNGFFTDGIFNTASVQNPDTNQNYQTYNFDTDVYSLVVYHN